VAYSWERLAPPEKTAILLGITQARAFAPPRVVELSWQDKCNIDCFFCSTAELRAGDREIPRERLERLFDEMADLGVGAVRLMGGGEPLFRRDAVELVEGLGRRGLRVTDVTTNAVLLGERLVRALFATGCDQITVSLNTATGDSYATMMQTAARNFDRVVENVRAAARIKRETGARCTIRLQFLLYRENYRQIPEMYRLFRESGADTFYFNGLYTVRPMPMMSEEEIGEMLELYEGVVARDGLKGLESFSFWERPIRERIDAATRRGFARGPILPRALVKARAIFDRGAKELAEAASLHEFCFAGWYSMAVNANGDAVTCCILQDRPSAVLGNIYRQSLEEIWNGPAYGRFRGELREIMARRGDVPGFEHACAVESVCAQSGACPVRSYYWNDDVEFRRDFHRMVDELDLPDSKPFATLPPGASQPLPSHPAAGSRKSV
jgi:MoaA/NifB/PqqE/SkfB family radical SAM enzyme